MNIKLSKSQWETIGKTTGWIKEAQNTNVQQPQQTQQGQPNASGWTFNRLMQDKHFQQTFETLKKQKENEKKILQYWESFGVQYKSIPEILDVIGTDYIY
ncbi:MAG: hypothetical protein WD512_17630 [Candidatus Paceibacterota bacterium]